MAQPHVLGIDVAKDELVVFDTATKQHLTINNDEAGLRSAIEQCQWSPATHLVGLESTGDYSLLPMKLLAEWGFVVRLLNPILTQSGIKHTVRGTKTDATDSELIAELTAKAEGTLITENTLNISKKANVRVERKLTAMTSDLKRLLNTLEQKAGAGVNTAVAESVIQDLITSFAEAQDRLWEEIRNPKLANHLARQEEIIASHIGCGVKLSTIISEEAGDIKRFASPRQLVAYAGIDPKVKQSGAMDVRGRMTKRGNNNLRHALYLAAAVACRFDPQLKDYFEKKRSEGKHYTVAVCAVARKMCERIYSTVTHDRLYERREVVKEPSTSDLST